MMTQPDATRNLLDPAVYTEGSALLTRLVEAISCICDQQYRWELRTAVVHYHGLRALGLLQAIQILVKAGLPREAAVLNRSLLNLLIDLAWLTSGDAPTRIQWFADCEVLTIRAYLDGLLRMGEITEEQYRLDIGRIEPQLEAFCTQYGYDSSVKKPPRTWAKPIKQLAYELSDHPTWKFLWRDYESSYRYLSAQEHTDPREATAYMDADSGFSERRTASDEDYDTLIVETCRYGMAVLLVCHAELKEIQGTDSLSSELTRLQDLLKAKLAQSPSVTTEDQNRPR